jgi:DNA-binding transcriptional LysR family regulator
MVPASPMRRAAALHDRRAEPRQSRHCFERREQSGGECPGLARQRDKLQAGARDGAAPPSAHRSALLSLRFRHHPADPVRHLRLLIHVVEVARTGSMRRAAERLNLTPSAINRRIQDLEAELGTALFERKPRGVKLTTAGEMFVRYARSQIAEAERLKSQVDDLGGLRRGPVQIMCSQALAHDFLASRIALFRQQHPEMLFDVRVVDRERVTAAVAAHEIELALIYRPEVWASLKVIASVPQRLMAIMRADHPLAARKSLRLSDCAHLPLALPDASQGSRRMLEAVASKRYLTLNRQAESNSFEMLRGLVARCGMISFQIEIGAPSPDLAPGLVSRPIDPRDVPPGDIVLCQLRGRELPVAAASFAELLIRTMSNAKLVSA